MPGLAWCALAALDFIDIHHLSLDLDGRALASLGKLLLACDDRAELLVIFPLVLNLMDDRRIRVDLYQLISKFYIIRSYGMKAPVCSKSRVFQEPYIRSHGFFVIL